MKKFIIILLILLSILGFILTGSYIVLLIKQEKVPLNDYQIQSRDALRISKIRELQTALEFYHLDHNSYPAGVNIILGKKNTKVLIQEGFKDIISEDKKIYMNSIPSNPSPGGIDYLYASYDRTDDRICLAEPCHYYVIEFVLEKGVSDFNPGIHYATPIGIE